MHAPPRLRLMVCQQMPPFSIPGATALLIADYHFPRFAKHPITIFTTRTKHVLLKFEFRMYKEYSAMGGLDSNVFLRHFNVCSTIHSFGVKDKHGI